MINNIMKHVALERYCCSTIRASLVSVLFIVSIQLIDDFILALLRGARRLLVPDFISTPDVSRQSISALEQFTTRGFSRFLATHDQYFTFEILRRLLLSKVNNISIFIVQDKYIQSGI